MVIYSCVPARVNAHTISNLSISVICMSMQSTNNTAASVTTYGAVIISATASLLLRLATLAVAALNSCAYAHLLYANKYFRAIQTSVFRNCFFFAYVNTYYKSEHRLENTKDCGPYRRTLVESGSLLSIF